MSIVTMSRLTLVLALYVALDLANPLMPGAFAFSVEDSVEAHTIRPIRADDSATTTSVLAPGRVEPIPEVPWSSFPSARSPRLCRIHVTRSHQSASAAATSLDDDFLIQ